MNNSRSMGSFQAKQDLTADFLDFYFGESSLRIQYLPQCWTADVLHDNVVVISMDTEVEN